MKVLLKIAVVILFVNVITTKLQAKNEEGNEVVIKELVNNQSYTIDEIMKIDLLTAKCLSEESILANQNIKITRYSVSLVPKGERVETFFGNSATLPDQFKACLGNLKSGDRIIIKDIYFKSSEGIAGGCGEITIYIK
ncbi:MAG: hypothetical protein IT243_05915 [Bacteroidia bacterium]|nr:hypothetical protein [Bacteroidia bacterium]